MELFRYTFHMKHDGGIVKISTVDTKLTTAMRKVLEAEAAPKRAIIKIIIQEHKTVK